MYFAILIPLPSYPIMDYLRNSFSSTIYKTKKNSVIKKEDIIVKFGINASLKSPVDGLVLFTGLSKKDLEKLKDHRDVYFRNHGTIWYGGWSIKEFVNDEFNLKKTVAAIIQPKKGSDISSYVKYSCSKIIKTIQ